MSSFHKSVNLQANEEWVLWMADVPLFSLLNTPECQATCQTNAAPIQQVPSSSASIQRNQYNAVVQRFDKAMKRVAHFHNLSNE